LSNNKKYFIWEEGKIGAKDESHGARIGLG
jgi:hypothetical protein